MKQIFTDAADLMNTTKTSRELETHAFNLGMGDTSDLESTGLMARSNAAVAMMDNINGRNKRDKWFEDLVYEQIRQSLNEIHAEIQWLDEQIKVEEKAIQTNNTDIDFIRTLDEDNIMGADGKPRQDVKALLKKYGYDDISKMDVADIMLITQTIETDLHNDNIIRKGRISDYQDRHDVLRDTAKRFQDNLPDDAPDDVRAQVEAITAHQSYEVNYRAMSEAYSENETVAETINEIELTEAAATISDTFKPF